MALTPEERRLKSQITQQVFQEFVAEDPLFEIDGSMADTPEMNRRFRAEIDRRFQEALPHDHTADDT